MKSSKFFYALTLLLLSSYTFAGITPTAPETGSTVNSPVWIRAHVDNCLGALPTSFGYSIDNNTATTWGTTAYDIDTMDSSMPTGPHTIHFKAWSSLGPCQTVNSAITVEPNPNGITVYSPLGSAAVNTPVSVQASVTQCNGSGSSAFGYSVDNNSSITWGSYTSVNTKDSSIPSGNHVLHFKAWSGSTPCPVVDQPVTVSGYAGPSIPPTAKVDSALERLPTWQASFDLGTQGSASGSTSLVPTPQRDGESRAFAMNFTNYGGERFSATWANDPTAMNFVYENWIWITNPAQVANLEMDMNQALPNGQTVIYGFQCDGWSRTWDYTVNTGTPAKPADNWAHTNVYCNPQQWSANTWHHIQVSYSRDANGNVTLGSVYLDGVQSVFTNATGNSLFSLGWAPVFVSNLQIDGMGSGSGSATVYSDGMTLYHW